MLKIVVLILAAAVAISFMAGHDMANKDSSTEQPASEEKKTQSSSSGMREMPDEPITSSESATHEEDGFIENIEEWLVEVL